jgi:hypothetical protein
MATLSSWWKLRLAASALVLVGLALALLLTSTPEKSPAETWNTWGWQLRYEVDPVEGHSELMELHASASEASRAQCVACHGDKRDSELPVHRIHLRSELLPNLACHDCHQQVDLASRGATQAVTWVAVGFCKKCHSEFPGLRSGSHMEAGDIDADCTECHTGEQAIRHAQPYLSQIIPATECRGCHGGRVLPWTPRHERDDWLEHHGEEALSEGTDPCFECHDFGLKFCDECHAEKPPSHLPEEQWHDRHPAEARADTRVCYTCHEMDFCKGCHVNHEEGWMESHPGFVEENGDSTCDECHSRSSCAYCHTEASAVSAEPTTAL